MFWGSFAGGIKGPTFVWEKEYGGIDSAKYIQHILPLLATYFGNYPQHVFQQDNAPSHRSKKTTAALRNAGIAVLRFPTYSPDLTPIENVWPWMKDWLEDRYGDDLQEMGLNELRPAIHAAWDAVPTEFMLRLAHSMPRRLDLCIEAQGGHIDY
jgi:transposase